MPKTKPKPKKKPTLDQQIAVRLNEIGVPLEFFNIERSALFCDCSYVLLVQNIGQGRIVVNMCHPITGKWMI